MSNLYIRVRTGFYTHRKTVRLRTKIGDAAFWVPPRIWAYAAENQPDGCFKDYEPEEIASFIGYTGDAQAMLQGMLVAGYFDANPLRIHDWEEHNGYHQKFSERAKNAAAARWSKKSPIPPIGKEIEIGKGEGDKHCFKHATSINGDRILPTPEMANKWLEGWKKNGADYSKREMTTAFLSLQANGWMWGKNPAVDFRAALECRIQENRDRAPKKKGNSETDGTCL